MSEHCVQDTGLTADAVRSLQAAWHTNYVTAKAVAVAAGGFEWHLLHSVGTPEAGAQCVAFFRSACAPHSTEYDSALMVTFANTAASGAGRAPNWREDLATFLLIRGEMASPAQMCKEALTLDRCAPVPLVALPRRAVRLDRPRFLDLLAGRATDRRARPAVRATSRARRRLRRPSRTLHGGCQRRVPPVVVARQRELRLRHGHREHLAVS